MAVLPKCEKCDRKGRYASSASDTVCAVCVQLGASSANADKVDTNRRND